MRVLVTGKGGQLSWELEQTKPAGTELISLGIEDLDITDREAVLAKVKEIAPQLLINAAAYTAVDKAEEESALAYAVNRDGAAYIAESAKECGAKLLHISTDFVYAGDQTAPYLPVDHAQPVNVYGASKLEGDMAVSRIMEDNAFIVRTAWLYSANGSNFVKTMLRLMAEREELGIICDQVGTPTWARGLALWLWSMVPHLFVEHVEGRSLSGPLYHWADAGVASWYDFAVAIQELGLEKGLLDKKIPIKPIRTSAYPTPARRPAYSVMDKTGAEADSGLATRHWRKQLSEMMDQL